MSQQPSSHSHFLPTPARHYYTSKLLAPFSAQLVSAAFDASAGNTAYAHARGNPAAIAEVTRNRIAIAHTLGIPALSFFPPNLTLNEEDKVIIVTHDDLAKLNSTELPNRVTAHAVITQQPGINILMNVADCPTITVYDPFRKVVALIHQSYLSGMAGTIPLTIQKMSDAFGCCRESLIAAINPSAKKCCFVTPRADTKQVDYPDWKPFIAIKDETNFSSDVRGHAVSQLLGCGLTRGNIDNRAPCSMCHNGGKDYFSFLRDKANPLKRGLRTAVVAGLR